MIADGKRPQSASTPEVLAGADLYLDAFLMLSASRSYSEAGPVPISITEIKSMLDTLEVLDIDDRIGYIRLIQQCDVAFRESVKKQANGSNIRRKRQPEGRGNGSSRRGERPRPAQG